MASLPLPPTEPSAATANIRRSQALLSRTLALSTTTVEEEIEMRGNLVDLLMQPSIQYSHSQYLSDAVDHLETILRRVPESHFDRPKYLNKLSFAKMSQYTVCGSRHALDRAVLYGRRAKELAAVTGLAEINVELYLDILHNLGFALSHRNADFESSEDLEEAIVCSREVYDTASKSSDLYALNLNNLASRLRVRHIRGGNMDDINEATTLLSELMSLTVPGTDRYGTAVGQLGVLTADRYKRTGVLQDFEEALQYCKRGLECYPPGHETRVAMLRQIFELYGARHDKTNDIVDLADTIRYSEQLLEAIPLGHAHRGRYLLGHLEDVQKYAFAVDSLPVFETTVEDVQKMLSNMPADYPELQRCQDILVKLSGKQYILSNRLQDLVALVKYASDFIRVHNDKIERTGFSDPLAGTSWLYRLTSFLHRLHNASKENSLRHMAEQELYRTFRSSYEDQNNIYSTLVQMYERSGSRLQVLVEAIEAGRTLSEEDVRVQAGKLKDAEAAELKECQQRPRFRPPEYQTELGMRQLAVDRETGNFVLDFSGFLKAKLGHDTTKPVSRDEFIAREAMLEQDFIKKAQLRGRHPNLNLCYMCRDLAKPLQLSVEGFEFKSKDTYLPFGNYDQLTLRKNCSICRLILAIISTTSGTLHPRLAAVDREVQGTSLSAGKLEAGEKLMRIRYGMRQVGELRILTPQNFRRALRQGWETDAQSSPSTILADRQGFVYDKSGQQCDLDLIKSWLKNCDHNHGSGCNYPRSGTRTEREISLTFIDVVKECLVSATSYGKYFALSYVWGNVEMSKTLRSNFNARQRPGGLSTASLPKTIKDAMETVRLLGERYLWVDAICIVQDDVKQMAFHIPNMDIIYGRAFATIIGLHGNDANAGLPGIRPGTRSPQQIETLTVSNRSPDLDHDPQCSENETISLVATSRALYLTLELSRWNSRGWILQERLLSCRCLYFSSDAVYFQCSQETVSEGGVNEAFESHRYGSTITNDLRILRDANHDNPLSTLHAMYDLAPDERVKAGFQTYKKLIETYSRREFSFKSDVLNAFVGMFAVVDDYFQSATFHGLPATILSHALLWTPAARLPRRGAWLFSSSIDPGGKPDPKFPSWSWAGWDGPVEYRVFQNADGKALLPTPMVQSYKIGKGSSVQVVVVKEYVPEKTFRENETLQSSADKINSPGPINAQNPSRMATRHSSTIPEAESKQTIAVLIPDKDRNSTWIVMGAQPPEQRGDPIAANILSFSAPAVPLPAFHITSRKEYLSLQSQVHVQSPQAVRRIHDRNGKHCGLWWEQAGYGYVGQNLSPDAESKIFLVGISAYGDVYHPRKGPNRVEGEINMFDDEVFPAVGPGSGIVNVLAVDLDMGHPDDIGDRCTVAIIHRKAWDAASPTEMHVRIA